MKSFAAVVIVFCLCQGAGAVELPAGVEVRPYTGWTESIYLNATETPSQVVIVPDVGGRVVHYSFNGQNILFENSAAAGKTLNPSQDELWLGGYQCDIGPRSRGLPAHLALLEGRYGWDLKGDFAAHVTSVPDPNLGVVLEKNFLLAPDTGELGIMQRVRNISNQPVSYCLLDRTICKGGGFIFFPLNPASRFKAGWSQRRQVDGKWYYDGDNPNAFQARVMDGVLVVSASGPVTQLGADTTGGWVAYARDKLLFVKYFPCHREGNYPDGGNTLELYFDQRAVELSPLSPEVTIAAGKDYTFPEKWSLTALSKEVTTWEEARKLVKKIPASPFRE
jgi:hypothetical protein